MYIEWQKNIIHPCGTKNKYQNEKRVDRRQQYLECLSLSHTNKKKTDSGKPLISQTTCMQFSAMDIKC